MQPEGPDRPTEPKPIKTGSAFTLWFPRIVCTLVTIVIGSGLAAAFPAFAAGLQALTLDRVTAKIHAGCEPQKKTERNMQQVQCFWKAPNGGQVAFSLTVFYDETATFDTPELDLAHASAADRRTYLDWAIERSLTGLSVVTPPVRTNRVTLGKQPSTGLPRGADSCRVVELTQSGEDKSAREGQQGFVIEKRGLWCGSWIGGAKGILMVVPILATTYWPELGQHPLPDFKAEADRVMRSVKIRKE